METLGSDTTDTATCFCKCKATLGSFDNTWKAIGKSYMSPLVTYNTDGLKLVGPVRPGAPNTVVEGR